MLVRSARATRLSARIDPARRIAVITAPARLRAAAIDAFRREHQAWILRGLAALPSARPFAEGLTIPLRGIDHRLERPGTRGPRRILEAPPRFLLPSQPEAFPGRVRRALAAEALADLEAASRKYAAKLKVDITSLTVKDTRSRWGSCASDGRLAYSWRLIAAPPFVLDYVAAHEVAHLKQRDHSDRFWALVEKLAGDIRPARLWLKRHAAALFALGAEA